MRNLKKVLSLVMALALVLSLGVTALAVTVNNEDGGEYTAYQIFKGKYDEKVGLYEIEWGAHIDQAKFLEALRAAKILPELEEEAEELSAAEVASALQNLSKENQTKLSQIAYDCKTGNGTPITDKTELAPGYYVLVETKDGGDKLVNQALLAFVGDEVNITTKVEAPSFDKQVEDTNDSTDDENVWGESSDHDIGDDVNFKLIAKMPSTLDGYETYWMIFHDKMDSTLKDPTNFTVTVNGTKYTSDQFAANGIEVKTTGFDDDCTFEVIIKDVLKLGAVASTEENPCYVTVDFTATLGDNAVIGQPGNKNTGKLEYDNNPNVTEPEPGNGSETPEDTVVVFTYEVDADKYDGDTGALLEGAGFTLYKWVDGAEAGYDPENPESDKNATGDATGAWVKVGDEITGTANFEFKGLDDGKYKLVETTVPTGYNQAADIEFEITADHDETTDGNYTLEVKAGETIMDGGKVTYDVDNFRGVTLPSTGGIGTTIFYVAGTILLVGAAILLVAKRRVTAE